jgi:splicing factor 3B subunit 2
MIGKEFELDFKEKKPGVLSKELMEALGMTKSSPPPW